MLRSCVQRHQQPALAAMTPARRLRMFRVAAAPALTKLPEHRHRQARKPHGSNESSRVCSRTTVRRPTEQVPPLPAHRGSARGRRQYRKMALADSRQQPIQIRATDGSPDSAIARGNTSRAARIRSQGKIHQTACNCGSRSARGSTRHTLGRPWVERRSVKVILTEKAESQFVRNSFANAAGTGAQKLLYAHTVDYCGGMRIAPRRITATGFETGYIDGVLNTKAQSIQWAASGGRQIESRYEGITLSNSDRGAVHSQTLMQREQSAITVQERRLPRRQKKSDDWETVTPWSTYFPPSSLSSHR